MVEELKARKIGGNLLSISSEIASCCFVTATVSFNVALLSLEQTSVSCLTLWIACCTLKKVTAKAGLVQLILCLCSCF